jgi:DHA2 family multidrug resistance protein
VATDYDAMVWPQILRGIGIMFCLLPTTRLALGRLAPAHIPDASGLFNLMRNLGGAIGLAVIDTILYGHAPAIGRSLETGLRAGDPDAAARIGLPPAMLTRHAADTLDPQRLAMLRHLIGRAALAEASNEAWAMLAMLTALVTFAIFWAKPVAMRTWRARDQER